MYEERGKLKSRFFFCLVPKKVVLSFLQACNVIMNVIFVYNESFTNRFLKIRKSTAENVKHKLKTKVFRFWHLVKIKLYSGIWRSSEGYYPVSSHCGTNSQRVTFGAGIKLTVETRESTHLNDIKSIRSALFQNWMSLFIDQM